MDLWLVKFLLTLKSTWICTTCILHLRLVILTIFTILESEFDNLSRGHITSVWPKYDYVCESYKKKYHWSLEWASWAFKVNLIVSLQNCLKEKWSLLFILLLLLASSWFRIQGLRFRVRRLGCSTDDPLTVVQVTGLAPLFKCMGSVTFMGPAGCGQSCKLANQVLSFSFYCKGDKSIWVSNSLISSGS